jgi:hypothetical protein
MTKTTQPCSWALPCETGKDLNMNREPEDEDNMSLMLSLFDSLNQLYENLCGLEHELERKGTGGF